MKHILTVLTLSIVLLGCNNTKKDMSYASNKAMITESTHPGKKLMETNCYVCHSPVASHDDRIGPPMIAVKKHYLKEGMTKEEFTKAIQNWINNPTEDNAKMYGAVKRFGLMPKQAFPEKTIQMISEYLYDNEIEQPEWFEDHFNSEKGNHKGMGKGKGNRMQKKQVKTNDNEMTYSDRGLHYALTTKAVLGKNLMGTIQKKGTIAALEFCNIKAYPLTDSMAVVHNASIKRVTDKPRNQNNLADSNERDHINTFKEKLAGNLEMEPIVTEINEKVHVYYPIVTNDMCLQCHGKPNQTMNQETLNKINQLYPNDKAIGYNINEIRGIWSISFNK
ncbi:c-type heme family protein [Psychroserpens mesophilus]|uniref:c-type heme family protein n=1 Tax=Psychroserpens mesophilus TaxID=325473 RepID=UPI003D647189